MSRRGTVDSAQVRSHRDLVVWQRSMHLVSSIYAQSAQFPKEERFGLTSQMRRAAISVPSNIAEGRARKGTAEYVRFLRIALGSIAELETQVDVAKNLNFLKEVAYNELMMLAKEVGSMLVATIRTLERKS